MIGLGGACKDFKLIWQLANETPYFRGTAVPVPSAQEIPVCRRPRT